MAQIEIKVPDIGDFKEVAVIELLVKPGDTVAAEQSLITVESDKASMEIPSSHAGVIKELKIALGDKVSEGSLLAVLETAGEGAAAPVTAAAPASSPAPAAPAPAPAAVPSVAPVASPAPAAVASSAPATAHQPGSQSPLGLPHASPSIRKLAREFGVPLNEVKGSGPKGRITQLDVQSFTRSVMSGDVRTQAQQAKAPAGSGAAPKPIDAGSTPSAMRGP